MKLDSGDPGGNDGHAYFPKMENGLQKIKNMKWSSDHMLSWCFMIIYVDGLHT
jgi:hypothetical protein